MTNDAADHRLILVVEDDALVRMAAVDILEDAGYRCIEAENAAEADVLLAEHPEISAMMTDVDMPGGRNGLELAADVRANAPDMPIIICSGQVRPATSTLPVKTLFVPKPYRRTEIINALDRLSGTTHMAA